MKKLISTVLSLIIIVSSLGAALPVVAEEISTGTYGDLKSDNSGVHAVAEVGFKEYETLQAALDAAKDGATVKLLDNVSGNFKIPNDDVESKSITLDMGIRKIIGESGNPAIMVGKGAELKIIAGEISSPDNHAIYVSGEGTHAIIQGTKINGAGYGNYSGVYIADGSTAYLSGCEISGDTAVWVDGTDIEINGCVMSGTTGIRIDAGTVLYTTGSINSEHSGIEVNDGSINILDGKINGIFGVRAENSEVIIDGGKITGGSAGDGSGIYSTGGTVTVNRGTIKGNYAVHTDGSDLAVNGGTITGTDGVYAGNVSTVSINGGTVTGDLGVLVSQDSALVVNDGSSISGTNTGIQIDSGSVTVNGGTVNGSTCGIYALGGSVTVNGGIVGSESSSLNIGDSVSATIIGGKYSTDVGEYAADGYVCVHDGDWYVVRNIPVAQIGETTYMTLQSALDAAVDGDTVKMTDDTDGAFAISGKSITLDTNGKIISATSGKLAFAISDGSNVTLTGSGQITGLMNHAVYMTDGSSITVDGGSICVNDACDYAGVYVQDGGTVTLNDGMICGSAAYGSGIWANGSTVTINGGTISCYFDSENLLSRSGVYVENGSTVTVNGGSISGDFGIYGSQESTIVINDGSIYGQSAGVPAEDCTITLNGGTVYGGLRGMHAERSTITITGGTLSGNLSLSVVDELSVAITGGKFSTDVGDYVVEDYVCVLDGDWYYVRNTPVAQTGETMYMTFQSALDAAVDGDTVKLLEDEIGSFTISGKSITLDTNGKTISSANLETVSIMDGADVTVTGTGQILNTKSTAVDVTGEGSRVTIDSVTISGINIGVFVDIGCDVTINGGTFCDGYKCVSVFNGNATINGGKFSAMWHGVSASDSTVEINGGTFNCGMFGADFNDCITTINGGTFIGEDSGVRLIGFDNTLTINGGTIIGKKSYAWLSNCTVTINGGTFSNENDGNLFKIINIKYVDLTISGGSFSSDVSDYVADGCECVQDGEWYVVGEAAPYSYVMVNVAQAYANEPFEIEVGTDDSVEKIKVYNEKGNVIGSNVASKLDNGDGTLKWILSMSVGTARNGRTFTVRDGNGNELGTFTVDILPPFVPTATAPDKALVNEKFNVEIKTRSDVLRPIIVNGKGNKISSTVVSQSTEDGITTWTLSTSVGTKGENRAFEIKDSKVDNPTIATFSISITNQADGIISVEAPASVKAKETFTVTMVVTSTLIKGKFTSENGNKIGATVVSKTKNGDTTTYVYSLSIGSSGQRTLTYNADYDKHSEWPFKTSFEIEVTK